MHLKDKGWRFCLSPSKEEGKWVHPAELATTYADWLDVTDMPSKELTALLLEALESIAT